MTHPAPAAASIWRQPMTVWAIAFASVVAFMGIGLVDPILPAIAKGLHAGAAESNMLFTSYLLVTGAAMLFTSWVSSRLGTKKTLLIGLALIVVTALVCALAEVVGQGVGWVIGFRAGWGLGNALFISTALAAIVGAATGGAAAAIVLYESALGLGIAIGPLLGGMLGSIGWQLPFLGVAVLMAIGFLLIAFLLRTPKDAPRPVPIKLSAPFIALAKVPAIRALGIAALCYNFGFFILFAASPWVLEPYGFGAMELGWTFFGWGVALAITSIWGAPLLTRRYRRSSVLIGAFAALGVVLVACGFAVESVPALIVCIIAGGFVIGILNTVLTESVMEASDLPRQVASGAYSGVRFIGGAIGAPAGPWLMTLIPGSWVGLALPYWIGALLLAVTVVIVVASRGALRRIDHGIESELEEAEAIALGDAD